MSNRVFISKFDSTTHALLKGNLMCRLYRRCWGVVREEGVLIRAQALILLLDVGLPEADTGGGGEESYQTALCNNIAKISANALINDT